MQPAVSHIVQLYWRSQTGTLTAQEQQAWERFEADYPREAAHLGALGDQLPTITDFAQFGPVALDELSEHLLDKIRARIDFSTNSTKTIHAVHRVHFLRRGWFKYAAAIIILFGIGAYLWNNNQTRPKENTAAITPSSSDILPGGQKATLTLADGRTIILDSAQNGQLATENGSEIIKRGDEIIYDAGQIHSEAVVYNTMSTPKGGQYQLTLPDGTKVWLNAASKITYPTRFVEKTREVKVEGEVYFEVKANAKQPFIVKTNADEITVLGTEFNINNYSDEPSSKISLINGVVKVNEKLLQPGQAYTNGKIIQTNIEQDAAWRNGVFDFNGMGLKAMMSQLEKWYDITVQYKTDIRDVKFEGKLSRDLTLSQMLEILEEMDVEFTIMGRTLIVRKNQ